VAPSDWAIPVRSDPEQAPSDLSDDGGPRSKLTLWVSDLILLAKSRFDGYEKKGGEAHRRNVDGEVSAALELHGGVVSAILDGDEVHDAVQRR
jgi:hypothetical protein